MTDLLTEKPKAKKSDLEQRLEILEEESMRMKELFFIAANYMGLDGLMLQKGVRPEELHKIGIKDMQKRQH